MPNRRNRSKKVKKSQRAQPNTSRYPVIQRHESEDALMYMFDFRMNECFCPHLPSRPHRHRRPLQVIKKRFNYSSYRCEDFEAGSCPRGNKCGSAHGVHETIYHPMSYKTNMCNKEDCKLGVDCSYAHAERELRDLREIFGVNWRSYNDPIEIEYAAEEARRRKEAKQQNKVQARSSRNDSWIQGDSWDADNRDVYSRSYSAWETHSHEGEVAQEEPDTPSRLRVPSESQPTPEIDMKQSEVLASPAEVSPREEFAAWFSQVYRVDDCGKWQQVLQRFQDSDLDSLKFLWQMVQSDKPLFTKEILREFLGLSSLECSGFHWHLNKRMRPDDVSVWMRDVVGLPQYADSFVDCGFVMETLAGEGIDLDETLTEMGITSFGHKRKIDFYLQEWKRNV